MVCGFRKGKITLKPDKTWVINEKTLKEDKDYEEYLKECIHFWKWLVESKEVDITRESTWRINNKIRIENLIEKISNENDAIPLREYLLELFSSKGENKLLWASWGGFTNFINSLTDNEIIWLKDVVLRIRNSSNFDDKWVDDISKRMISKNTKFNKLRNLKSTVRNLIGELFGKLHIEKHPIYNGNAKSFLDTFFDYNRNKYEDFEECFNKVKDIYLHEIGRLSPKMPENMEVDAMFNLFYHGKKDFGNDRWRELWERWENKLPNPPKNNPILEELSNSLLHISQIILYGPPGTGKTWLALQYAKSQGATKENGRLEFVTFHPSFSYEDFVEGIRPESNNKKELIFEKENGIFKRVAMNAFNALMEYLGKNKRWKDGKDVPKVTLSPEEKEKIKNAPAYYLIIDEINRGDISKIFGELITLLEKDKRLFGENEIIVTLPYSKTKFGVPPNLYIIGTMNTADRSIALIDVALRRRFAFVEMMPDMNLLREELGTNGIIGKAIDALEKLNERIIEEYDRDHQIGHSYYLQLKGLSGSDLEGKLRYIWLYEILPLLQEYFYGNEENIKKVLFKCDENTKDIFECYRNKINDDIGGFLDKIIQNEGTRT